MRKYMTRGCEECGQPHTPCKMDDEGLYLCHDCQESEKPVSQTIYEVLAMVEYWREEAGRLSDALKDANELIAMLTEESTA